MASKFHTNLAEAQRAEIALVRLYEKLGIEAWLNILNPKWGDVWRRTSNGCVLDEVKTDFESVYTGNVYIEKASLDRRAEGFIYFLPEVYFISKPNLKTLALSGKRTRGGDFHLEDFTVSKESFIQNSKHLY